MENLKIINRIMVGFIIVTGILAAGASLWLWDARLLGIWAITMAGVLVVSVIMSAVLGVTLIPLLWLIIKAPGLLWNRKEDASDKDELTP